DADFVRAHRLDRGTQTGAFRSDGARGPAARRVRAAVQGLCGDRAGCRRRPRSPPPARRAAGAQRPGCRPVRRNRAARNGGSRGGGHPRQVARGRTRARRAPAPARRRRRAASHARSARRHRRRRGGAVRGRPAADVPAVRRNPGLAVRTDLGKRVRNRRLQGGGRLDQRIGGVRQTEVRERRPPGPARAGDRERRPHSYVGGDSRGAARSRGRRRPDRRQGFAHRRLPLVGTWRPVGEHHRQRGAHHAPAVRAGRHPAGREVAAQEQGQGAQGPAHPAVRAGARAARQRTRRRAQVDGRLGRPVGAHPHLQFPPGPRHRPPHQPDAAQARGSPRRPRSWPVARGLDCRGRSGAARRPRRRV
ncbi:MAG: Peptide chain release factor 1, partial [uncultured Sphingomonas sp.]